MGDGEDAASLFRAALKLPKYKGLGLKPDTTPVGLRLTLTLTLTLTPTPNPNPNPNP